MACMNRAWLHTRHLLLTDQRRDFALNSKTAAPINNCERDRMSVLLLFSKYTY